MAITYTWKITGMKTRDFENKPQAVVQTYWQKIGTNENDVQGTFSGATPFTVDPTDTSGPFIPFENLTEQNVIDWIKEVVVGSYQEHVDGVILKQIQDKITPVKETALPWAPVPEPTGPAAPPPPAAPTSPAAPVVP